MAVRMRYGSNDEATKKTGAGGDTPTETETVLWENPNPGSNFSTGTVTLSQGISNFKRIRLEFATGTSGTYKSSVQYDVNDISDFEDGNGHWRMGAIWVNSSGNTWCRRCDVRSDTSIYFYSCQRVAATTTSNPLLIPQAIYGIN